MDDKVLIMDTGEDFGGDFIGLEKMVQISACVIFTTFTVAVGFEGREIVSKFSIFDVYAAIFSVKRAVSSHTSGANTIKSITSVFCADEQIDWFLAHA